MLRHLRVRAWKGRDPEPNPIDFKIVEDWTEEFSDEPLINLRHRFCPCAEANGSWSSDPDDWEVPMVAPKALPYLEEIKAWKFTSVGIIDSVRARGEPRNLACFRFHRAFYKGGQQDFARGQKGIFLENMKFFYKVNLVGSGFCGTGVRQGTKIKMNLVNKEL